MAKDNKDDPISKMFNEAMKPERKRTPFTHTEDDKRFSKPDKSVIGGYPKPKYGNPPKRK